MTFVNPSLDSFQSINLLFNVVSTLTLKLDYRYATKSKIKSSLEVYKIKYGGNYKHKIKKMSDKLDDKIKHLKKDKNDYTRALLNTRLYKQFHTPKPKENLKAYGV